MRFAKTLDFVLLIAIPISIFIDIFPISIFNERKQLPFIISKYSEQMEKKTKKRFNVNQCYVRCADILVLRRFFYDF